MLFVVQHEEADMFNDFLREMKDDFIGTRYSAFWDKVVEGMLIFVHSLISTKVNSLINSNTHVHICQKHIYRSTIPHTPIELDTKFVPIY